MACGLGFLLVDNPHHTENSKTDNSKYGKNYRWKSVSPLKAPGLAHELRLSPHGKKSKCPKIGADFRRTGGSHEPLAHAGFARALSDAIAIAEVENHAFQKETANRHG
jgi:hypothetical protein